MENQQIVKQEPGELTVQEVVAQVRKVQEVMDAVMKKDEHYGIIPGTQKPTLLKPGAEKLCLTFRLDPQYDSTELTDGPHLTIKSKCTLWHIPSNRRMGSGEGSCSTKETKYAYRESGRTCPKCGKATIIKGKQEYGGGWLCFAKKGGCGAKFSSGDKSIESQTIGRVANEDIADQYNTVLKMANKRSLVAAVLNVTAASDLFTQDVEDLPQFQTPVEVKPAEVVTPEKKQEDAQLTWDILASTLEDARHEGTVEALDEWAKHHKAQIDGLGKNQKEILRKSFATCKKEAMKQKEVAI